MGNRVDNEKEFALRLAPPNKIDEGNHDDFEKEFAFKLAPSTNHFHF